MKFSTSIIASVVILLLGQPSLTAGDGYQSLKAPSPLGIARADVLDGLRSAHELNAASAAMDVTFGDEKPESAGYKNRGKAFLRSLLLPGAGEHYLGHHTLAKSFFITEISLWVSFFSFRTYGNWLRDDAIAFAATHSGAQPDGKPSQFLVDIGNYSNVAEYNDAKQRMRQFDKVYTDDDYFWAWDSDINRHDFEQLRIASDRSYNRSVFVLGGIFANHIISAFDAVWRTRSYNKNIDKMNAGNVSLNVHTNYDRGEISLNLRTMF
ncbi:MAG: hypothetical protein ACOY90_22055 [Candidatus Zhuqueibacterota bacterium]